MHEGVAWIWHVFPVTALRYECTFVYWCQTKALVGSDVFWECLRRTCLCVELVFPVCPVHCCHLIMWVCWLPASVHVVGFLPLPEACSGRFSQQKDRCRTVLKTERIEQFINKCMNIIIFPCWNSNAGKYLFCIITYWNGKYIRSSINAIEVTDDFLVFLRNIFDLLNLV